TTVEAGDVVRVDEGAFAYRVLSSSATDYGLITGEGVKLQPLSNDLLAWGYRPGDDAGALANKAWRLLPADATGWKTLRISAGRYVFRTALEIPHLATLDVGRGV